MPIPPGASYTTLKTEFETNGIYTAAFVAGDNTTLAALANGDDAGGATIDRTTVPVAEVQSVVDSAEYDALTVSAQNHWALLIAQATTERGFVIRDAGLRAQVLAIFVPGTTRTAFAALQTRLATEMEELYNAFTFESLTCTLDDVRRARLA